MTGRTPGRVPGISEPPPRVHPTLAQAITVEVITVVEALWGMSTDEIDVDAVAAEVIRPVPGGYAVTVTEQAFQEAVERHVR